MAIITDDEKKGRLSERETEIVQGSQNVKQLEADSDDERAQPPPNGRPSPGPRSDLPPPSPLRRFLLIFLMVFLLWLAIAVQKHISRKRTKPQIIYASRYSKEFKYRPAASPIITETLKDGRIRLRGASPPTETVPTPTPKPKRRRTRRKKAAKKSRSA